MNFNNILSQIIDVDSKGFDATKDSYFNRIDTSGTDIPPATNNASNQPNISKITATDKHNLRLALRNDQSILTEELQRLNPTVPLDSILNVLQETSGYDRKNLSKYEEEFSKKYGNLIPVSAKREKEIAPNFSTHKKTYNALMDKEHGDGTSYTQGSKETGDSDLFGFKNATNKYGYKEIIYDKDGNKEVKVYPEYEYLARKKDKP